VSQGGERVSITFSVGLATVREGDTAESLIQRVDQAMYKSKQSGRNQTHASAEEGELLKVGV
jgi:diguanylate cyclase